MKTYPTLMLIVLLILGLAPISSVNAQEPTVTLRIEQVDTTNYPSVTVRLSAWDTSGLPLANLKTENFALRENNGASFRPQTVQVDTETALSVGLVLDISGSMAGEPLTDARVAAARFLDRLKSGDRAALIAFSDPVDTDPAKLNPRRELAFTSDLAPMYDIVESLTAQGQTQLYNAELKAVQMIAAQPVGHRAVLLLSDGRNEPAEVGNAEAAIRLARENNIPFFVIGLGDQIDEVHLRKLASETGGLYRSAPRSSELAKLFNDMATLLKTQYVVSYESTLKPDGAIHNLTIVLNAPQGQIEDQFEFGPLPSTVENNTPIPATQVPESTDVIAEPTTIATASPSPEMQESAPSSLGWALAAILALSLGILFFWLKKRRAPVKPEVCSQCGFDVTGTAGACSQCGSARRLPKRK